MSAQAYTNRRRVLAEVGVQKVQYKKFIAENRNPLAATINCDPNFSPIIYKDICTCPFNGYGTPIPSPTQPSTYDGGNYTTQSSNILDGGSSATNITNVLSGS
jgi:hypothetical protein